MAEKKVKIIIKMLIKSGAATPAPPVGSTLGPHGLNLKAFCDEFNSKTSGMTGMVPVEVTIYEDRSYSMELKTPPVSELVKQELNIQKGSGDPLRQKVATITMEQVQRIAEKKMPDLNCYSIEEAIPMVIGTCKSMGVKLAA